MSPQNDGLHIRMSMWNLFPNEIESSSLNRQSVAFLWILKKNSVRIGYLKFEQQICV